MIMKKGNEALRKLVFIWTMILLPLGVIAVIAKCISHLCMVLYALLVGNVLEAKKNFKCLISEFDF